MGKDTSQKATNFVFGSAGYQGFNYPGQKGSEFER